MTKFTLGLSAALLALGATTSFAQDDAQPEQRPSRGARFVTEHDTNGDGAVTADEITKPAQDFLAAADVNGDGTLSTEEFRAGQTAEAFLAADADGNGEISLEEFSNQGMRGMRGGIRARDENEDGQISLEEMTSRQLERLTQADADGNGSVTAEEYDAHQPEGRGFGRRGRGGEGGEDGEGRGRRGRRGGEDGQGRGGRGQGGPDGQGFDRTAMMQQFFERIDTDSSGSISLTEFEAMIASRGERGGRGQRGGRGRGGRGQGQGDSGNDGRVY